MVEPAEDTYSGSSHSYLLRVPAQCPEMGILSSYRERLLLTTLWLRQLSDIYFRFSILYRVLKRTRFCPIRDTEKGAPRQGTGPVVFMVHEKRFLSGALVVDQSFGRSHTPG
jgi:hypothetical protein